MNKPLILVVEDDNSVKNLITTTLKAHDYRYLTAPNGADAILEASSHNPDIVLLDLGLPDIDGVDVIKKIRTWSNMPIIVISARSEDTDKIDALDAGADDYLTKPFSVEELLARLSRNVGKVLTHTFITQSIWGSCWNNDIASLRVFMATLRKKLEKDADSPQYIQTHIGVGYRMMKVE